MTESKCLPVLKAMLTSDQIITEANSGKRSIIGIFEKITIKKFPHVHPTLSVYVKFSDAEGEYKFLLELFDIEENKVIGKGQTPNVIRVKSRLHSHDLVFNLAGLKFNHAGVYEFRIFANGKVFGQKTFSVTELKPRA